MMDSVEHTIRLYDVIVDIICATQWLDDARDTRAVTSWAGLAGDELCSILQPLALLGLDHGTILWYYRCSSCSSPFVKNHDQSFGNLLGDTIRQVKVCWSLTRNIHILRACKNGDYNNVYS